MDDYLTSAELRTLTGFVHREKVCTALATMGITFKVRPSDKFILVLRKHRDEVLSGGLIDKQAKRRGPNWAAA